MKKLIIIMLVFVLLVLVLCACNKQIFDFDLKFEKAYVKIGDEWKTIEVSKWNDYEGEQIQLTLKDGTVLLVNSVNCILYQGQLPN